MGQKQKVATVWLTSTELEKTFQLFGLKDNDGLVI